MKSKVSHVFLFVFVVLVNASLLAQGLNWSAPQSSTNTASPPGGLAGRPAISGVYFNFAIWAAERVNDSSQAIMMLNNNGSGTTFYNQGLVILPGGGYALSAVSPALTAMNGSLYLAYTDTNGLNQIISSQNGTDWTGPSAGPSGPNGLPTSTQANPAITADPANNTIYTSYTNGQYFTPIMCQWVIGNQPSCTQNYSLDTANFNPGIAFWNGIVYFGYEHRGDSHCLFFYKYDPVTTAMNGWTPIGCNEQTSAGPSLVVHNNALYVGFRTNDSSAKFTIRVSTDGNTLNFRQQPGFTMDGYPDLVDVPFTPDAPGVMNLFPRYNAFYTTLGK